MRRGEPCRGGACQLHMAYRLKHLTTGAYLSCDHVTRILSVQAHPNTSTLFSFDEATSSSSSSSSSTASSSSSSTANKNLVVVSGATTTTTTTTAMLRRRLNATAETLTPNAYVRLRHCETNMWVHSTQQAFDNDDDENGADEECTRLPIMWKLACAPHKEDYREAFQVCVWC